MRGVRWIVIVGLLFLSAEAIAQGAAEAWVARYNGPGNSDDRANALAVDTSGNVYVTGRSYGSGSDYDYATIKYKPNGDTLWLRRYNGPGDSYDEAYALAVDTSGNVYVTGNSVGSGSAGDYATIKYAPNGDTLWVRRYNGPGNSYDGAEALAVDTSGNVYVTGWSVGSGSDHDYATIKYAPNGDTLWVRRYNGPGNGWDAAYALAVDDSGNVYVTGESVGSGGYYDYATIKYASNGDTAWVRRHNGPGNSYDGAYALDVDDSGNVYVTGYSSGVGSFNDYATIKYAPNGNTLWVRRYNGPGNDVDGAYALALDNNGNVYVTGWSVGSGSAPDYATIKYKPNGDTLWVRRYNGPGNSADYANALALDTNGNVYVAGYSSGVGSYYDYATIKYATNGDTLWVRRYNGTGNNDDIAYALAMDRSGNVYVVGSSTGSGTSFDYATIKYAQAPYPMIIQAFSPVDMIVTDPNNDSISVGFNNIPGATYTTANDSIYIPAAEIGDYKIRVVKDTLDLSGDTSYAIEARIDGTKDQVLAKDEPVPGIGESNYYVFTSDDQKLYCISEPGDANADRQQTLSDVIATVNYIFNKSGCTPKPDCWFKGAICRGNWNGDFQVTLSDVIWAVNYIFNKPGGPWNPIAVEPCCLPLQ